MGRVVPLTVAEKARIIELARSGMSRNAIAREVGRAASSVSNVCLAAGIPSDAVLPAAFVQARALSVKERQVAARERKLLIDELHDARVLATLRDGKPWTTRQKTTGGGERFVEVSFIPADDFHNIASASASIASAFRSYAPLETGGDIAAAESVVDAFMDGIRSAYNRSKDRGGDVVDAGPDLALTSGEPES